MMKSYKDFGRIWMMAPFLLEDSSLRHQSQFRELSARSFLHASPSNVYVHDVRTSEPIKIKKKHKLGFYIGEGSA